MVFNAPMLVRAPAAPSKKKWQANNAPANKTITVGFARLLFPRCAHRVEMIRQERLQAGSHRPPWYMTPAPEEPAATAPEMPDPAGEEGAAAAAAEEEGKKEAAEGEVEAKVGPPAAEEPTDPRVPSPDAEQPTATAKATDATAEETVDEQTGQNADGDAAFGAAAFSGEEDAGV